MLEGRLEEGEEHRVKYRKGGRSSIFGSGGVAVHRYVCPEPMETAQHPVTCTPLFTCANAIYAISCPNLGDKSRSKWCPRLHLLPSPPSPTAGSTVALGPEQQLDATMTIRASDAGGWRWLELAGHEASSLRFPWRSTDAIDTYLETWNAVFCDGVEENIAITPIFYRTFVLVGRFRPRISGPERPGPRPLRVKHHGGYTDLHGSSD